jgi:hypothetical protein
MLQSIKKIIKVVQHGSKYLGGSYVGGRKSILQAHPFLSNPLAELCWYKA